MEADAKARADRLARQAEEECKIWESAVDASLAKAEKELEERRRDLEQERKQKQDLMCDETKRDRASFDVPLFRSKGTSKNKTQRKRKRWRAMFDPRWYKADTKPKQNHC